jgi:uncharacterized protein (DUF2062 family)
LHTILAALIAIVWRLNKVAIFSGSYINNPWTVAPIAFSWFIGHLIIGSPPIDLPEVTAGALDDCGLLAVNLRRSGGSYCPSVGASILSITTSLISYPVMLHFFLYRRRNADRRSKPPATVVTRSVTERN